MNDLSKMTSILIEDTAATLLMLGCVSTIEGNPVVSVTLDFIEDLIIKFPMNGLQVDIQYLHWSPLYVTDVKKDKWAIKAKRDTPSIEATPTI